MTSLKYFPIRLLLLILLFGLMNMGINSKEFIVALVYFILAVVPLIVYEEVVVRDWKYQNDV